MSSPARKDFAWLFSVAEVEIVVSGAVGAAGCSNLGGGTGGQNRGVSQQGIHGSGRGVAQPNCRANGSANHSGRQRTQRDRSVPSLRAAAMKFAD